MRRGTLEGAIFRCSTTSLDQVPRAVSTADDFHVLGLLASHLRATALQAKGSWFVMRMRGAVLKSSNVSWFASAKWDGYSEDAYSVPRRTPNE
jgi:hypothetical protein